MDNLFKQFTNISKAHAYDIVSQQVKELKEIICQLLEVGELEDLTFTNDTETAEWKSLINKAKIASI